MSDLSPERLVPLLRGRLGQPYRFVESCASTQRLLGDSDPEGAAVAADEQTEGRGRLGRRWEAPAGRAILCSVLLRPELPMPLWPELSLVAGKAVADALRAETGIDASLRHPNDVVVAGRKLAGLLAEAQRGRVVLGIGVNVNQPAEELPVDTPKLVSGLAGNVDTVSGLGLYVTEDVSASTSVSHAGQASAISVPKPNA